MLDMRALGTIVLSVPDSRLIAQEPSLFGKFLKMDGSSLNCIKIPFSPAHEAKFWIQSTWSGDYMSAA